MGFEFLGEGLIFIGCFFVIIALPCLAAAYFGTRLIAHIGRFPTKSAGMQMQTCLILGAVQVVSFGLLAVFFHVISD